MSKLEKSKKELVKLRKKLARARSDKTRKFWSAAITSMENTIKELEKRAASTIDGKVLSKDVVSRNVEGQTLAGKDRVYQDSKKDPLKGKGLIARLSARVAKKLSGKDDQSE